MTKPLHKMSRKKIQASLMDLINDYMPDDHVFSDWDDDKVFWQDRPFTAVWLAVGPGDTLVYEAYGFTKVCWPDRWDAGFGKYRALEKAVKKLAKKIYADQKLIVREMEEMAV